MLDRRPLFVFAAVMAAIPLIPGVPPFWIVLLDNIGLSALVGVWITGGDNNVFVQVGLVVLMGLACKNAILIVEFARELELQGKGIVDAALDQRCKRFRIVAVAVDVDGGLSTPTTASSTADSANQRKAARVTASK